MPKIEKDTAAAVTRSAGELQNELAFHQAVAEIVDPFQVVVITGAAGSGKTALIRRTVSRRPEVLYLEGAPGHVFDLETIALIDGGGLVIDEVRAFEQESLKTGLSELARQIRAGERKLLVILIAQFVSDLSPLETLLPEKLVHIELPNQAGLILSVGARNDVLDPSRHKLTPRLAFIRADAEAMLTRAFT